MSDQGWYSSVVSVVSEDVVHYGRAALDRGRDYLHALIVPLLAVLAAIAMAILVTYLAMPG